MPAAAQTAAAPPPPPPQPPLPDHATPTACTYAKAGLPDAEERDFPTRQARKGAGEQAGCPGLPAPALLPSEAARRPDAPRYNPIAAAGCTVRPPAVMAGTQTETYRIKSSRRKHKTRACAWQLSWALEAHTWSRGHARSQQRCQVNQRRREGCLGSKHGQARQALSACGHACSSQLCCICIFFCAHTQTTRLHEAQLADARAVVQRQCGELAAQLQGGRRVGGREHL